MQRNNKKTRKSARQKTISIHEVLQMSGGVGRRPKGAGIVFAAKKIVEIDKLCDRLLSARQETMGQAAAETRGNAARGANPKSQHNC